MNTPICDFIREYQKSNPIRLHVPGHKGKGALGIESWDITEIHGADSLYFANGIIARSEKNATDIFGSEKTFYSCEGSSLCIRAMLYMAMKCKRENQGSYVLATRNAHSSFITGASLLGFDVEWIFGKDNYLSVDLNGDELEKVLESVDILPFALYVTSPDYLGNTLDISSLAKVCHKHGILLIVDNAHGAYLKFLTPSRHPLDQGADLCCDSAHKTLPTLTGCAYLHISKNAPKELSLYGKEALSLFGSTSPSYLMLASLDNVNLYLTSDYKKRLNSFCQDVEMLKNRLRAYGYEIIDSEPLKLTIKPKSYGYTGIELGNELEKMNIFPEFYDKDFLVLMLSCEIDCLSELEKALISIEKRVSILDTPPKITPPKRVFSIRESMFKNGCETPISNCLGSVLSTGAISCPPAVSLVVSGEEINQSVIDACEYYGIDTLKVIKERQGLF